MFPFSKDKMRNHFLKFLSTKKPKFGKEQFIMDNEIHVENNMKVCCCCCCCCCCCNIPLIKFSECSSREFELTTCWHVGCETKSKTLPKIPIGCLTLKQKENCWKRNIQYHTNGIPNTIFDRCSEIKWKTKKWEISLMFHKLLWRM
jgi:hypothetical protein